MATKKSSRSAKKTSSTARRSSRSPGRPKRATAKRPRRPPRSPSRVARKEFSCDGTGGFIYFLGFVGALIYYLSAATSFWTVVLGILKAIIWPTMLVIKLLGM